MKKSTRYLGLDVHAETIAVAVAQTGRKRAEVLGTIPNRPEAVRRLVKKLGAIKQLRACYEAGPCGYDLYWQLTKLGVTCEVVAPTLVPVKAGDRVKTDQRDARKLAQLYRAGELTPVWVPDEAHEALRDLVRAREAAKADQLRARHRLGKFLLRHGIRRPSGMKSWTAKHRLWLQTLSFEYGAAESTYLDYLHEVDRMGERIKRLECAIDEAVNQAPDHLQEVIAALQALRGVAKLTATTIVAEVGALSRFAKPKQLMGYAGMVPTEASSGGTRRQGAITKTGNAHLRRVLGEAAWSYRRRPNCGYALRKRQEGLSEEVKAIAWQAQHRLYRRYVRLQGRGKTHNKIVTAIARELLGFVWAVGVEAEQRRAA